MSRVIRGRKIYNKNNVQNNKDKGFTLVEVLAVVVIISVVIGIGFAIYFNTIEKSKERARVLAINNITDASELYSKEYEKIKWLNKYEDSSDVNVFNVVEEYVCVTVNELINSGYFKKDFYKNELYEKAEITGNTYVRITRDIDNKANFNIDVLPADTNRNQCEFSDGDVLISGGGLDDDSRYTDTIIVNYTDNNEDENIIEDYSAYIKKRDNDDSSTKIDSSSFNGDKTKITIGGLNKNTAYVISVCVDLPDYKDVIDGEEKIIDGGINCKFKDFWTVNFVDSSISISDFDEWSKYKDVTIEFNDANIYEDKGKHYFYSEVKADVVKSDKNTNPKVSVCSEDEANLKKCSVNSVVNSIEVGKWYYTEDEEIKLKVTENLGEKEVDKKNIYVKVLDQTGNKSCENKDKCINNYVYKIDNIAPEAPAIYTMYQIWKSRDYGISGSYSKNFGVDGTWTTTGGDPYIYFNDVSDISGISGAYVELEDALSVDLPIQIFYATSSGGYSEVNSDKVTLSKGTKKIVIPFTNTGEWTKVRFDIGSKSGLSYKIKSLAVMASPKQWNRDNIILQVSTTENGSGVDNWQYTYASDADDTKVTDDSSDSSKYWVIHKNSSSNPYIPSAYSAERNQPTYIRVCDKVGNCSVKSSTDIKIDKTDPKLNVVNTVNGVDYKGEWTNQNIKSVITFSDTNSGINAGSLAWGNDGLNWKSINNTNTSTYTDTWSAEGSRNGYYKICDNAGNCKKTDAFSVKIDKTPPTLPGITTIYEVLGSRAYKTSGYSKDGGEGGTWTTSSGDPIIDFSSNVSDISGITGAYVELSEALSFDLPIQIFYATSSGGYSEANSNKVTLAKGNTKIVIPFSNSGSWSKVRFDLGSSSGISYKIKSLGVIGNANQWNRDNIILQVSTTENGSGIDNWQYTYLESASSIGTDNKKSWVKYDDSSVSTFITTPYSKERNQYTYINVCDKAGNCSNLLDDAPAKTYIKIDKTAPSAPTIMEFVFGDWSRYTQGTWSNKDVYAANTSSSPGPSGATDSGSGVAKYQISSNDNTWVDYSYDHTKSMYGMTTDGTHTRYFRAVDNAGNIGSALTRTARIDKTGPVVKFGTNGNSTAATSQSSKVTVTDVTNGTIATSKYVWSTSNTASASNGKSFTSGDTLSHKDVNGTYYLCIYAKDGAGNVTNVCSNAFKFAQKYTVKYDCDGGSGAPSNQTITYGSEFTTASMSCTKAGYTQSKWVDLTGDNTWTGWSGTWKYDNGQYGIKDNVLTLKAQWTANTYTVALHSNGGQTMSSTTGWSTTKTTDGWTHYHKNVTFGSNYGSLPTPTRSGYTFNGWYNSITRNKTTTISSSTDNWNYGYLIHQIYPGTKFTIDIGSATLTSGTATKFTTKIYDFTSNTQLATIDKSFGSNVSYEIACPESADPTHYIALIIYAGVAGSTSGNAVTYSNVNIGTTGTTTDTKVTSSSTVLTPRNHTLYGRWTAKQYTVSYNCNGGSGAPSSQTATSGSSFTIASNTCTKSGYSFAGWTTNSNGTDDGYNWTGWSGKWAYDNGDYGISNNSLTLYARWTSETLKITFNSNGGTGTMSDISYTYGGSSVTLPNNTYTKTGYSFKNWRIYRSADDKWYGCTDDSVACTSSAGNTTIGWHSQSQIKLYYTPAPGWVFGSTTSGGYDLTFYAQWTINKVYVQFHMNGGTWAGSTNTSLSYSGSSVTLNRSTIVATYSYGQTGIDLANWDNSGYINISRTGYAAKTGYEWCKSSSGGTTGCFTDSSATVAANDLCDASNGNCTATLYVNWVLDIKTYYVDVSASSSLNCRTSTSTANSSNIKASYKCGVAISGYVYNDSWVYYPGNSCYLSLSYLSTSQTLCQYYVTASSLRCRTGPSTDYDKKTSYNCGDEIFGYPYNTEWTYYPGNTCYLSSDYLSASSPSCSSGSSSGGSSSSSSNGTCTCELSQGNSQSYDCDANNLHSYSDCSSFCSKKASGRGQIADSTCK